MFLIVILAICEFSDDGQNIRTRLQFISSRYCVSEMECGMVDLGEIFKILVLRI